MDERPLPVPGAFRLPASNGYTLYVAGVPPHAKRPGKVLIFVYAKGKRVTYSAPATVTEASIQSDLGELGEISVTFQRSNRAAIFSCGKRKISFDSGEYEGRIEFHGEEGYTSVEATTAPGNFDFWGAGFCEGSWESGGSPEHARGAELFVRNPGLGPELSVRKSRPGAAVLILAWDSEFTNGILIEREIGLWMPGSDFTFDRRLRTATVRPPAPFAGSAQFDLTKKAGQRWSGDLMVDLPGRMGVPLTGPLLRATLVPSE
ncbi:MAG TPA: hypothetical protein VFJ57_10210 [Solirubrobacterales bacterium]|nr:hypothetical protein [Solirubrobacterales bacterium]